MPDDANTSVKTPGPMPFVQRAAMKNCSEPMDEAAIAARIEALVPTIEKLVAGDFSENK